MALDSTKIRNAVKNRIYQSGLGQKPSIRTTAAGSASVAGDIVTFSTATGQGAKLRDGQILSSYSAAAGAEYVFYVTNIATEVITAVNGYGGEAIANAATMPTLLEHQADVTEYQIQRAVDDCIDTFLFPEIFDIVMDSFTPNLATLQATADVLDEDIIRAWQKVGQTLYQVPIKLIQNLPTAEHSTGKMLAYDAVITTDVDYSSKRKVALATSTGTSLESLIAKGAAALVIEGIENAPTEGEIGQESRKAWGSFYNAKRQLEASIAKEAVTQFKVDRA